MIYRVYRQNPVSVDPCSKCIIFGPLWEEVVAGGKPLGCLVVSAFSVWHNRSFILTRSTVFFTGTYHRMLDDELRVLIPKRLRSSSVEKSGLYLAPGTNRCLELHTNESLQTLTQRAQQTKTSNQNVRSFSRLFYARASFCEFDKQNRIRIPKDSADWAGLEKEVVLVGVGFNWEIWNLVAWEAYLEQNSDSFDGLVNHTFSPLEMTSDLALAKNKSELAAGIPAEVTTPAQKP